MQKFSFLVNKLQIIRRLHSEDEGLGGMSLRLSDFAKYNDIVIQCHDNPDADALASGLAMYWYLQKIGKQPRFVYGGKFAVHKSNLVLMKDMLDIPAEYVTSLDKPEIIIYVDCQRGESNVTSFEAENYAVIDHHQVTGSLPAMAEVRSGYGACSTIMWELIDAEGLNINEDENLATALYYGLMTDTNGFTEIEHPADKDLRDSAKFIKANIILFKNSNISRDELRIAGDALQNAWYDEVRDYAIVEAEPCDPNILGIISDMLLEVDSISTCLVYSVLPFGIKISVRSCVKEVKASELAAFIAEGYGGGGGHLVKAGGFMKKDLLDKESLSYDKESIHAFMEARMKEYFVGTEILYAGIKDEDITGLKRYTKRTDVVIGYVDIRELAPIGTKVTIRTLEGDIDTIVNDDTYIVIGVEGEIYPVKRDKFEAKYKTVDEEYEFPGEYSPMLVNIGTGERIEIISHAHACVDTGGVGLYIKPIDHRVKVFTTWDREKYYLGIPGDFLAIREDDLSDIYIIAHNIFMKTYEENEG